MSQLKKEISSQKLHAQFMALFLLAYITFAISYTQILPFLSNLGYSSSQRGLILSGSAIVGIIGQFIFGFLCDRFKTVKKMFYISSIILIFTVYFAYSITRQAFFFHLIMISLLGGFFRIVGGLLDSWTIERDPMLQKNFGIIRAFGSIGWIIGSSATVWILSRSGYEHLSLYVTVMSCITLVLGYRVGDAQKVTGVVPIKMTDIYKLLRQKQYIVVVVILTIVSIALNADGYIVVDKILALGGSASDVSNKWVIQAIFELPLFFFGSILYRRYSAKSLLMIGIFMFMIRCFLSAMASSPLQLVMISSSQMVTFPFILLSSKLLIDDESPTHLKSSGQLLGLAMYAGISALLAPLIAGFLIDGIGIDQTLIFFGLICVIPLILSVWYKTMRPAYRD